MKTQNENEMFRPDPKEFKYTIQIDVYDNVCLTLFRAENGDLLKTINYHNVIGVLETQKQHLVWNQRESNKQKKLKPKYPTGKKNGR